MALDGGIVLSHHLVDPWWRSLLGLLSLALCIQPEYILISNSITWNAAQNYCRTNHFDLATVQSNENWTRLQEAASEQSFSGYAWVGLYNDINSWHWSYNNESVVFKSWAVESANTKFLIKIQKTWADAQKYCRDHYTDLVTIRSQADQDEINSLIITLPDPVWIGLYRNLWAWSDGSNVTSSTVNATQGFTRWNEDCVAANNLYKKFDDRFCTSPHYFYCNTVKKNRQVIRVQVKGAENMDEAKLKTLVLNKLQQTLRDEDVTVMWRTQPNGKVFQEINTVQNYIKPICAFGLK
ncbi:uncharacterized protein LOC122349307 [Puntigrus tetrazona]|uniref:uncharacterized protein LOC122349307 n=1 Tax=Puntigrus tetrazona TaxID=1606681 RepID=UPI001C8A7F1D|nr:uncharacterized protein LOC122349307 [Puntigrus tetrazona]